MRRSAWYQRETVPGTSVALYPVEARLVSILREGDGRPVPHQTVLRRLWPERAADQRDMAHLRELVYRVRTAFEAETGHVPIQTVLGRGYVWQRF